MAGSFLPGVAWLFVAGALCLASAYWLGRTALHILGRAFGPPFGLALYALLTLPGFFLHEGAHALAALLLRIPLRGVTFIPRHNPGEPSISSTTEVGQAGPLRLAIVALAPLMAGTVALGSLSGVLSTACPEPRPWVRLQEFASNLHQRGGLSWAILYLIWAIGSHMAPSRKDLRHVQHAGLLLFALLLLIGLCFSALGGIVPDLLAGVLGRLGDGLCLGAVLNGAILVPLLLARLLWRR